MSWQKIGMKKSTDSEKANDWKITYPVEEA